MMHSTAGNAAQVPRPIPDSVLDSSTCQPSSGSQLQRPSKVSLFDSTLAHPLPRCLVRPLELEEKPVPCSPLVMGLGKLDVIMSHSSLLFGGVHYILAFTSLGIKGKRDKVSTKHGLYSTRYGRTSMPNGTVAERVPVYDGYCSSTAMQAPSDTCQQAGPPTRSSNN